MANGYLSATFADTLLLAWLTHSVDLPGEYFVGLTLALPTDDEGTGIEIPDAIEYARAVIPADADSWASMGEGSRSMESSVTVAFPTAETDWGQILGYTLHDQYENYVGFGILNPYTITVGMTPRLPAGTIVISLPIT